MFYQIYPQSYYDLNGDGIGDLPGITAKLDYIYSIGCNAIWINPIFESPFGDAGYDVADFYKVAPRYGRNNDVKNLCAAAHKRGMHVCLDLVAGHTSIAHPWFQQSALDRPNHYSKWYIWTPASENIPGSQPFPGEHNRSDRYLPNFFPFQPALNYGYARSDPNEPWRLRTTDPVPEFCGGPSRNDRAASEIHWMCYPIYPVRRYILRQCDFSDEHFAGYGRYGPPKRVGSTDRRRRRIGVR